MGKKHYIIIFFLILGFCFLGFIGTATYMKYASVETNIPNKYTELDKEIHKEETEIEDFDNIIEVFEETKLSTINLLAAEVNLC